MRTVRQITVRVPSELYDKVSSIAKRSGTTINQLVCRGLETLTKEQLAEQMKAAYEALAASGDTDVEYAFAAQREVIFNDPE